jgi:DNA-binding NarL/FixJ family response regulator
MLLDGLVYLLRHHFRIVGTALNGRSLIDIAKQQRPDVIVMDITMSLINGIDAMRILQKEGCLAKILFLTMHSDLLLVEEAFRAGASGFLLKICGIEEFLNAVGLVAKGATYITPLLAGDLVASLVKFGPRRLTREIPLTLRQREVLQLIAEGKTMKEIAAVVGISSRTAEAHKYEIMRLLGVQTSADLVRYAIRIKLVYS